MKMDFELHRLRYELAFKAMQLSQLDHLRRANDWNGDLGEWFYDTDARVFYFNPLFFLQLGYSMEEMPWAVTLETMTDMVEEADQRFFKETFGSEQPPLPGNILSDGVVEFVFKIRKLQGGYRHIYIIGKGAEASRALPVASGDVFDVTAQYDAGAPDVPEMAPGLRDEVNDELTGVLNGHVFNQHLRHTLTLAKAGQQEFCLLLVDVDFFRNINDHFGRDKGDAVLKDVGRILKRETRHNDFVGRIGGDRFEIILTDVGAKTGRMISERIRKALSNHMFVGGIRITASGGLVYFSQKSYEELLDAAEALLLKSKRGGHNIFSY